MWPVKSTPPSKAWTLPGQLRRGLESTRLSDEEVPKLHSGCFIALRMDREPFQFAEVLTLSHLRLLRNAEAQSTLVFVCLSSHMIPQCKAQSRNQLEIPCPETFIPTVAVCTKCSPRCLPDHLAKDLRREEHPPKAETCHANAPMRRVFFGGGPKVVAPFLCLSNKD